MSQQTIPTCALGLSSADLSAWRDETLSVDQMARIGEHSANCPACQERLQGFETIAATLRAQRAPIPDERLWQSVLAALAEQPAPGVGSITREIRVPDDSGAEYTTAPSPRQHNTWRGQWRTLGTLAAVAAIVLVVVGFGRLFWSGASTRPTETFQLHWRQVTLPGGMGATLAASASLSVFERDGSIAWICQSGTDDAPGPLRVWRTNNAGATWQSMQAPRLTKAFDCQIQLDQLNPGVAVLDLKTYVHPNQSRATSASFATVDGGAHWQDNPAILPMTGFATLNGATYALLQNSDGVNRLMVSGDGMKTWSVFDDAIHNKGLRAIEFWVHPITGSLLVETFPLDGAITSLWRTDADGRGWHQLTTPLLASPILVPTTDGYWNICSMFAGPESAQQPRVLINHITCGSTKSGHWTTRPGLNVASAASLPTPPDNCSDCILVDPNGPYQIALAADGAALALYTFHYNGAPTWGDIYRLPAGSTQWQKGGRLPTTAAFYAPHPGGGILWSLPAFVPGTSDKSAGPVSIASYPGPAAP